MDRKGIIGIDCGVNGGIAFGSRISVRAINMPDTLDKLLHELYYSSCNGNSMAYVEDVPPFVGTNRPAARIFKLAKNYGVVLGMLHALGVNYEVVRPAKWMSFVGAGKRKDHTSDNKWKNHLKRLAQKEFTETKVTLKTADALLILKYGMERERNGSRSM